ncbi:hypothetical protein A1D30_15350 [Acidovorax sp. GW101-3H11]|nr:hypothetical protein A1D30_15350 [Acidovorax sp. GW101-3H11]
MLHEIVKCLKFARNLPAPVAACRFQQIQHFADGWRWTDLTQLSLQVQIGLQDDLHIWELTCGQCVGIVICNPDFVRKNHLPIARKAVPVVYPVVQHRNAMYTTSVS